MGGLTGGTFGGIGKKIQKLDPLRGGDRILEAAGVPTLTGQGDKSIFGAAPEVADVKLPSSPTIDDAVMADDASRSLARRRGRQSTVLSSTNFNQPTTSAKTLLGA